MKTLGWSCSEIVRAYFHHSELQAEWAWELIGSAHLKGDEKILDFGCGDGKLSALLSRLVTYGEVTGLEISSEMLRFARCKFPAESYNNLSFCETLPENKSYDVICSFSVFHLVPNPLEILSQLRQKLTDGGRLLLTTPMNGNSHIGQAAKDTAQKYGITLPLLPTPAEPNMQSIPGCQALLNLTGFQIEKMNLIETPTLFIDRIQFRDWMIGTLPALWNIPWDLCPIFFSDVITRMEELNPHLIDADGCVRFYSGRLHILAKVKIHL